MRIALLAPDIIPSWGGVGTYTYNLVNNLPKSIDIHIITIDRNINFSNNERWNENVKIHRITKISSYESFFYNLKFQLAVLINLKQLHKKYHFDLIHSHAGHLPHLFSQFQEIAPLVVTVHGETKGSNLARKGLKYQEDKTEFLHDFFSRYIELGEKINYQKADWLLPISEFTLKQINQNYHTNITKKAHVIHNGVDTERFKPIDNDIHNPLCITFIGRLYSIKGLDIFIDALSFIKKLGYNIQVKFLGRGNRKYLDSVCSSVLDKNSYSITGMIDYNAMPYIYQQSDVVVLPSVYEGCSGTILETLSSGKIAIASNAGGTPEIIKHGYNGLLFESRKPLDLADRILDVIEKRIDINQLKQNARNTAVNQFSWKDKSKEVYQDYLKILRKEKTISG